MKTLKITTLFALMLTLGIVSISSCKKKTEEPVVTTTPDDDEQTSVDDNAMAENTVNDMEAMGSQVSESSNLSTFKGSSEQGSAGIDLAPCAIVTASTVSGSKSYTVDFGTTGCLGTDGRTRTGKLIFAGTGGAYRNPGFAMTVVSQNYVVDGHTVTINNKTIANTTPSTIATGTNPGTNLTWAITATVTIQKSGGGTISWYCNRTKELMNTSDPNCYKGQSAAIDWTKAKVKINGTAGGTNASSESYSVVATNLIRDFGCFPDVNRPHRHPFIGGTILYTPAKRFPRLIDYGNGTDCDFNATLTINGKSYAYTMK
jgi:hypothetical protein